MTPLTDPPSAIARRPEIEGLRGVAVLLILFYHAGVPGFRGGFVGVDLFFVLSGYLIALTSWGENGRKRFNLLNFVESRSRRIIPATILLLAVLTFVSIFIFLPSELTEYGKHVFFSSTFVPNVLFWKSSGYFDTTADRIELIHLWSLGVEVQFYVTFALLGWASSHFLCRRAIQRILLILFAISLSASVLGVYWRPEATFYLLPTRLWEFIAGALTVRVSKKFPHSGVAGWFGMVFLLVSAITYTPAMPFPGLAAVPVVVGSMAVLACRSPGHSLVWLLSLPALRWIGRISFALYLWHWPFLVIPAKLTGEPLPAAGRAIAIALAVLVAAASTFGLEHRFVAVKGRSYPFVGWSVAACVLVAAAGLGLWKTSGLPFRTNEQALKADTAARDYFEVPTCFDGTGQQCYIPPNSIFVWGDSHAEQWIPGIRRAMGRPIVRLGGSGCPPLSGVEVVHFRPGGAVAGAKVDSWLLHRCKMLNSIAVETLRRYPQATVLVGGAWSFYANGLEPATGEAKLLRKPGETTANIVKTRQLLAGSLEGVASSLVSAGHKVVIIADTPQWDDRPSSCLARSYFFGFGEEKCARPDRGLARVAWSNNLVRRIAIKSKAGLFVPSDHLCPKGKCMNKLGSAYVYHDSDHVTSETSRWLAKEIARSLSDREL